MPKARVRKEFEFAAAHHLPMVHVGHPCGQNHGHTWKIIVEVYADIHPETGFVVDFSFLKRVVEPYIHQLDHSTLNDVIENPTSENLAVWLLGNLAGVGSLPGELAVEVYESPRSMCRVGQGDL